MSRVLKSFFLMVCCGLTFVEAGKPCNGFNGTTSYVFGSIGTNISIKCNVPTNCSRGLWRHGPAWFLPKELYNDTYFVSHEPLQNVTTLYIYNVEYGVEGEYTCYCDGGGRPRTTEACFNLTLYKVQYSTSGYKKSDISYKNVDRCSMKSSVKTIELRVHDNITIKCADGFKREINCSQINNFSFIVEPSHHLCSFSCKVTDKDGKCEGTLFILDAMNTSTSASDMKSPTEVIILIRITQDQPSREITTSSFQPPSLDYVVSNKMRTSTTSEYTTPVSDMRSPTEVTILIRITQDQPSREITTSSSQPPSLDHAVSNKMRTSTTSEYTTPSPPHSDQESPLYIVIASCIIFVLAIIALLLCVHIQFYKIGIRSCKDKEEWINPLYESADNGTHLPIVIPNGGNPYGVESNLRQLADCSSAENTTNNVHQIDGGLGMTHGITIELEAPPHDVITLGQIDVTKKRFKQDEGCQTTKETDSLQLPELGRVNASSESSGNRNAPTSPHLYELVNMF